MVTIPVKLQIIIRIKTEPLLLHDEMFQKKWEESELKQLIDKLRKNKDFEFEQMRFYPR
jgi:hypothetical protein